MKRDYEIPYVWQQWFETIETVFAENEKLAQKLWAQNEDLEQRVRLRTNELEEEIEERKKTTSRPLIQAQQRQRRTWLKKS